MVTFFNVMWRSSSTRHLTTWLQICVFIFVYSFIDSHAHALEYYIRRGFDERHGKYEQRDVFGYANGSNCLLTPQSFNSQKFNPTVNSAWPQNIKCTYRCGIYSSSKVEGAYTFLPEEKKCLLNTEVRTRLGGCMVLFDYENSNRSSLFVLNLNKSSKSQLEENKLKHGCKINGQQYYISSGHWENIPTSSITFKISKSRKILSWNSSNPDPYVGRIIRIQLQNCKTNQWPHSANECIVFKAKGFYHYKPFATSTVNPEPCPTVTTMASPLLPSTSEQLPVVTTSSNTTSAPTEDSKTPYDGGDSSGQEGPSNVDSDVIVGVVTPCVIIIITCLLVAVWCKRRSNHKERSRLKAANPSVDNPAYERNKNQIIPLSSTQKRPQVNKDYDNVEYDYASVDGQVHANKKQPVYQSLDRGNANVPQIYQGLNNNPDSKKPGLNQDKADCKEDYSYNHLQHPTYNPPHPKDTSDSSYSSLQKPGDDHYLEPETQTTDNHPGPSEPVYNVLEGPDDSPAPQDHDPVYNVLEDPNANQDPQDNDPVYNVLENPDDDYDNAPTDDDQTLPSAGQDNAAYSSTIDLKMPQRPSSPDYDVLEGPDGALPDPAYQPLGIRAQDEVYQPLDRTSQSIYQSLEPNDSTA